MLDTKPNPYDLRSDHQAMLFLIGKLIVSYNNDRRAKAENIYNSQTEKTNLTPNESFIAKEELDMALKYANQGSDGYELSWLFRYLELLKID